jgi:hypothetical protein
MLDLGLLEISLFDQLLGQRRGGNGRCGLGDLLADALEKLGPQKALLFQGGEQLFGGNHGGQIARVN